ncbi:hypothetical protein AYO21_02818 [Fonsecaea monophora]|uniref:Translation initiation factor eIF4E n=1 Tax=Fonsecaea monophora TaxID=254056 RepID=A0A177FFC1_9EURO|nr:hypothetical protein AYO21_02818 [Fonsecaea monophora]OAG42867.1 hypothetical protein AYO21_02818 [Fonsecaea monophora]
MTATVPQGTSSPVTPATSNAIDNLRPSLPRRSSSLHKQVIAKLRPLPFQYRWSVWHSKSHLQPTSQQSPDAYPLTMLVDSVADIGTFYRIFNNLPWSQIKQKDSIHIFRSGVQPLWEDEENRRGGRWLIRVRPEEGKDVRCWEEICLLCCGGELQAAIARERDHILGMSFSPRQYFTHISIWTKKGDNLTSIMLMERAILAGLSPDLRPRSSTDFNYRRHAEKMDLHTLQFQGRQSQINAQAQAQAPVLHGSTVRQPVRVRALTVV